jgi:MFS family permease
MITVLNLSIVSFLVILGLSMVAPILPSYAESFQVSYSLIGFVISSFAVTRMILDMPAGFLSRRYEKKIIMITGLILIAISSVTAGLASTYTLLIISRMIEGAGSALYVTSATILLTQIAGIEKRGRLMSLYTGMLLLGSVFGPSFGGGIALLYDIRAPFFSYAIIAGIGVLPTILLPNVESYENMSRGDIQKSSMRDIWSIITYPSFLLATLATFTLFFLRTGVRITLVPLFADNNLGLDTGEIGLILTFAGIATASTMLPIGGISDRIGRRLPLIACLFLSACVIIIIPLSTNILELIVCMVAYGAIIGLSGPIAAFVADVSPQDKVELSMGLYRMISDMGYIIGPLLLGYLADISVLDSTGTPDSGLIGLLPFIVASIFAIVAGFAILKANDPVRSRNREASVQDPVVRESTSVGS